MDLYNNKVDFNDAFYRNMKTTYMENNEYQKIKLSKSFCTLIKARLLICKDVYEICY